MILSIIGTISGTSADGIDLAELKTDGRSIVRFGPSATLSYAYETRGDILAAIEAGPGNRSGWADVTRRVTQDHAAALSRFIAEHALEPDLVVFHGQTVWHDPAAGETVQLGCSQTLADVLGVRVVGDLRHADVAAGGQGAPLVPLYHQALAHEIPQPLCFLNIGGVSNLTYIDGSDVRAFDIGPGNALIDDWVRSHQAGDYDPGGAIAARGKADETWLEMALAHPFFRQPGPKSLDRNAFSKLVLDPAAGLNDGAATLTSLTARCIGLSESLCPKTAKSWLVCGGGRLNDTLMEALRATLQGTVEPVEAYGLDGDALEAQAMAFLGARTLAGLPTSIPETTGARRAVVGGRIYTPKG